MNSSITTKLKQSVFLVFPGVFLMLSILIHYSYGKFYMVNVDPEYFHLFNGLNLSIFNLSVDFIHHPGTTVQVIFAVSARVVNLILPGNNIISNALNNPEQFIHGANILLNLLTSSAIFLVGVYTYKYTKNVFLALLLQLMPFVNYKLLIISGRLIPEAALTAPILILAFLIVRYLYDVNRDKNVKQYLVGFAIVGGLGIAGKLLFLPFLIIPLFVFNNSKTRLRYLFYAFLATIVFAFPLFVHIGKTWDWVSNMFIHSGKWGHGDPNVFDIKSAPQRLKMLYSIDKSFFAVLAIASFQLMLFYMFSLSKKLKVSRFKMKILLGVLISVLFSIILITKHFAFHYFYPTLVFKALIIFLMAELLMDLFHSKKAGFTITAIAFATVFTLALMQQMPLAEAVKELKKRAEKFDERALVLKNYNTTDNPLIISNHFRGSPFVESSMVAGLLMSGHLKTTFVKPLAEKFPNTYFVYNWSDQFYFWDQFKDAPEFVDPEKPLYIFIGEGQEKFLDMTVTRLENAFSEVDAKPELLHFFSNPDEYFYKVNFTKTTETESNDLNSASQ